MRRRGICGRQKGRYRVQGTDRNHNHPISSYRLVEALQTNAQNLIRVAYITYIPTAASSSVGPSTPPSRGHVLCALAAANLHRQPPPGMLFHPARGVQYAVWNFRDALTAAELVPSMGRRDNFYVDASMETYWSTLKPELVYRDRFATRRQSRYMFFGFIEAFNDRRRRRRHTPPGGPSPAGLEPKTN